MYEFAKWRAEVELLLQRSEELQVQSEEVKAYNEKLALQQAAIAELNKQAISAAWRAHTHSRYKDKALSRRRVQME